MKRARRNAADFFPAPPVLTAEEAPMASDAEKRDRFWLVYGITAAALVLLLLAAIGIVRMILADYESARPVYVAEQVFQDYFCAEEPAALLEKSGFELSAVENEADFRRFWSDVSGDELSLVRVSADSGGECVRYNVRAGEKTLAAFELTLSGETTRLKNPLYSLSKIELGVGARHAVSVSAPSDATVYLNGVALGEAFVSEAGLATESCAHMPEGVRGITYTVYEAKGLLFEPEIEVRAQDGRIHPIGFDEETGRYVAALLYDEALEEEMRDYAIEAAQTYAAAMQNDRSRSQALAYLERDTDLYWQTQGLTLFVADHSGYRFENVEAGEFLSYDENTFSCRVSFTHVLTGGSTRFNAQGENREHVDITWYFRKVGDRYLIYDRENN